ncbi:MAG: thioredoxin fold domain-containing protein [Lutibacter sp.]|jgi:thioredoxin-related protein|nr:thioredoxin fold domain-containing protein [Lutibacter sp.]
MKKTILLLAIISSLSIKAQKIQWMSLEEAVEAQKIVPKKIITDAYTHWCGPCKMLDKNTFGNKDVATYINEHYYAVKFNAEGNSRINYKGQVFENPGYDPSKKGRNSTHQLTSYFQINAYPTLLFFDEKGEVISPIRGYQTPRQLELYLKLFHTDAHLQITTREQWESYVAAFDYEFEE